MRPCRDATADTIFSTSTSTPTSVGRTSVDAAPAASHSASHLLQRRFAPGHQDDMVASDRRLQRDGSADAARRARDDEDPGVRGHGLSTTLTQPSCFFWNIS